MSFTDSAAANDALEKYQAAERYITDLLISKNYLDNCGTINFDDVNKMFNEDKLTFERSDYIIETMKKEGLLVADC